MVTAKRLTVSMIALLAGFSLAHAQTTPGADPHHPETQTQGAKPGAPMTPPPGKAGAMGMDMGKTMGGGMMPMMPMMRMMHGMEMMPGQHVEGRIAFLKAELGITEAQSPQWNAFAGAMRGGEKTMHSAMAAHMQAGMPATAPAHSDAMIAMMTAKLEAMKASAAAGKTLYAVLTETQKKTADELMMARMGGM